MGAPELTSSAYVTHLPAKTVGSQFAGGALSTRTPLAFHAYLNVSYTVGGWITADRRPTTSQHDGTYIQRYRVLGSLPCLSLQAQSSPPKPLQSSSATASAYPQLSNLYPSEDTSAGPSTSTPSGRPAAGPGAGFPARPPQPAAVSNAYGGYGAPAGASVYGNGYAAGMGGSAGMGQQGDKGEKNVTQMIVDSGNKWSRA